MRPIALTFVILLVATPAPASAGGEGGQRRLSLEEALRIGLERNPTLAAVRAEAEAAGAGERVARSARWPRLLADAGWRRTDNQVLAFGDKLTAAEFTAADFALDSLNHPDPIDHASAGLGLEAPLFTSGRIRNGIAVAREEAGAARARGRATASDLVTRITEAYYGVSLARGAVGVAEAALSGAQGHERAAAARTEAGAALKSDLLRARVRRLDRERDLERRRADLDVALARLRTLLGLHPGETVEPSATLEAPVDPLGDLDAWLDRASGGRPEIDAARRSAAAAEAAVRSARAALGPELAGTARYERNASGLDAGEDSFLVGVSLRWAAFDRGRAARIEAARARSAAAAAWRRAAEDGARLEVEEAYRDVAVADRNLAAAREAAAAAGEARRISAERYAGGLLPLTDLLDVETALIGAQLAELSALYDATVGRALLARAAGALEVPR